MLFGHPEDPEDLKLSKTFLKINNQAKTISKTLLCQNSES
jgi:hypothetical protein